MTEYQGYTKIPLSLVKCDDKISKQTKWAVTEKIHGSCFCFVCDVDTKVILYAKRKQILTDDDNFFGYKAILPELLPKIRKVCDSICEKFIECKKINIYGELFGGYYPNIISNFKPVQSGIYYSPNLHFYAFDISIQKNDHDKLVETYLDYANSIELFKINGMLCAEPLKIFNSYQQATEFPIYFNSTIPSKLGLNLQEKVNFAEGIVIRSTIGRFITKIKIKEFSESKYDDNEYDNSQDNSQKQNLYALKKNAAAHITKNRLNNAISKIGEFENNREEILDLFLQDILTEINCFHQPELVKWLQHEIEEFVK